MCSRSTRPGLTNAVAIMGTSLTEEQVAELERVVGSSGVLELCLDADRAGQEAMLRAAQLADGRKLDLRVVPLPEGMDPAELIQREGGERLRERVAASVPFVAFHVERILDRADAGSAEGQGPSDRRARAGAEAARDRRRAPRGAAAPDLQPPRAVRGAAGGADRGGRLGAAFDSTAAARHGRR